ncbi:RFX DNA-binding domain-containing protein [Fimicolochytrium jonesii]|uniref:RFX DNA-binding domain-containing protein n=1 Tax=Fimicolochytrium jonesii TaxID=1396493 RepID=UPI0022FEEEA3|nr:RFX DNA-binding domain-containing protein [Fimicolochytrium jonesii]KAI8821142.1 RFX DNA-binding domain-containing protein [Fimicolochytrium jonesii]
MLESKDTLEQLAAKAGETGPQADKARSILVTHWLMENYEQREGISIPRSNLYDHYCSYCVDHKIDPVNSASFGKLIRSVFPDIKTRRLGTRGKSKYHYCGIQMRNESASVALGEGYTSSIRSSSARRGESQASSPTPPAGLVGDHDSGISVQHGHTQHGKQQLQSLQPSEESVEQGQQGGGDTPQDQQLEEQDPTKSHIAQMPALPALDPSQLSPNLDYTACQLFLEGYKQHCQELLQSIQCMKFNEVEGIIREYWEGLSTQDREIVNSPDIIEYIWRYDSLLYDTIMNLLLPNVLQMMPIQIIQAVRQFARQLEPWMLASLHTQSPLLTTRKIEVVKVFIQQLRRHTSLNHLAQATAAVLDNPDQVAQMLADWNRIDFENILDQASWVCECRKQDVVQLMELDFRALLSSGSSLQHWTTWLETCVNRFLAPSLSLDPTRYVYVARQFLLKWAFFSSLAMRDLTLRSATSFGSFHLLRLLFDEYVFYLVEQRIANVKAFEEEQSQVVQAVQQVQVVDPQAVQSSSEHLVAGLGTPPLGQMQW